MNLKKKFKYLLPVPIKKALKYLIYFFQDTIGAVKGTSLKGYPPKRLNFVGSAEFKKVGDEFVEHFVKLGGLKPSDTVLDIGSGIGRMAIPLTKYLTGGEYFGFDIDKTGVVWCQKNISPKFSKFHFQYVDIYNKYYNKNVPEAEIGYKEDWILKQLGEAKIYHGSWSNRKESLSYQDIFII